MTIKESGECERCGGSSEIVESPTTAELKAGESRRLHTPCPDCQPQSKEEEDWPEEIFIKHYPNQPEAGEWWTDEHDERRERRRYIPAPESGNENSALRLLVAILDSDRRILKVRPEERELFKGRIEAMEQAIEIVEPRTSAPEGSEE